MDSMDRATETGAFFTSLAIQAICAKGQKENTPSRKHCLHCDSVIPMKRRKTIQGVKLCVDCQARFEKEQFFQQRGMKL